MWLSAKLSLRTALMLADMVFSLSELQEDQGAPNWADPSLRLNACADLVREVGRDAPALEVAGVARQGG